MSEPINMENINKIDQLVKDMELIKEVILNQSMQKRWLTVAELAEYLGYSTSRIYKLKDLYLTQDQHYSKKSGKLLFDRVAVDSWLIGKETDETDITQRQIVDHVLSSIEAL